MTAIAYVSIYYGSYSNTDNAVHASTQFMCSLMYWFFAFYFVVTLATMFGKYVAEFSRSHLLGIGRFPIFELTNGDKNKQNSANASSTGSVLKFMGSSVFTVLW